MRRNKIPLIFLVMFGFLFIACAGYAQPKSPRESIPSDIPADVKVKIEALYSPSAIERVKAARDLGAMRERAVSAIPYLKEMQSDNAAAEWEEFGFTHVGKAGRYIVSTTVANEARGALQNIGEINAEKFIDMLRNRKSAATAASKLGYIKDERAVIPLIDALKDQDVYLRESAAEALGHIGDVRAVEPLINTLGDSQTIVKMAAAKALEEIGKPAVDALITAGLSNKATYIRTGAIELLGKIGDTKAIEPLITLLKDADGYVSHWAADALGDIGDKGVVPVLIEVLQGPAQGPRSGAASALGKIKDTQAIPALINALDDKDEVVKNTSAMALEKMTGQNFGKDKLKWQEWREKNK